MPSSLLASRSTGIHSAPKASSSSAVRLLPAVVDPPGELALVPDDRLRPRTPLNLPPQKLEMPRVSVEDSFSDGDESDVDLSACVDSRRANSSELAGKARMASAGDLGCEDETPPGNGSADAEAPPVDVVEGSEASWVEMPVRTLSNARKKLVDPAVKADERASLVGPRFFSRWSSCMPSLSRRPMSDTALVSGVGCVGSQMSKRTGSVAWSHCWKAAVDRSSLTQGKEKLATVLETARIWIGKVSLSRYRWT